LRVADSGLNEWPEAFLFCRRARSGSSARGSGRL